MRVEGRTAGIGPSGYDGWWLATEDGTPGKGTGRHIACFVLDPTSRFEPWP